MACGTYHLPPMTAFVGGAREIRTVGPPRWTKLSEFASPRLLSLMSNPRRIVHPRMRWCRGTTKGRRRSGSRLRRQAHASRADQAGIGRLETPEGAADGPLQKDIPVVRAAERKVGRRQVAVRPPPLGCPTAPPHAWMGDATGFQ